MENKWIILILFFAIFINLNYFSYAKENQVSNINIEATIEDNGNVNIIEEISGDFYLGTELYIFFENLLKVDISNFVVIEDGVSFQNIDEWNIVESREYKEKKCSVIENLDGIELVWGIGSSGKHEYKLKYTINGVFQNSELNLKIIDFNSLSPQKTRITINGNFEKNAFASIGNNSEFVSKEKGKIIYDINEIKNDIIIYLNYNGIDNSVKKEQIIKIKSNDKTKVFKFLKSIIIIFWCLAILIIISLVLLYQKQEKYEFKPF